MSVAVDTYQATQVSTQFAGLHQSQYERNSVTR